MSKNKIPLSGYPQPQVHRMRDQMVGQDKISIVFISEDHLEAFRDSLYNEGKRDGEANALKDLQRDSRTLIKNILGIDLERFSMSLLSYNQLNKGE